jgi:hypothetical protein
MAHTIDEPIAEHFDLLRLHSTLSSSSAHWDSQHKVTPHELNAIGTAISKVLKNQPVRPQVAPVPSFEHSDYGATAIVDASCNGFGAIVLMNGTIYELKGGFKRLQPRSAHAEPLGATKVLEWLRSKCKGPFAIVSDHVALSLSQRRPVTGNGGFAKSCF